MIGRLFSTGEWGVSLSNGTGFLPRASWDNWLGGLAWENVNLAKKG